MKFKLWHLAALLPVVALAATNAFGAQLAIVGVTLAIFFGTLTLNRPSAGDATTTHPGH